MTRRLMPNSEPVHVFAQVAISQGSRCVLYLSMLSRNSSMELATSRGFIKEISAFTMMPNTMPVRLQSLH